MDPNGATETTKDYQYYYRKVFIHDYTVNVNPILSLRDNAKFIPHVDVFQCWLSLWCSCPNTGALAVHPSQNVPHSWHQTLSLLTPGHPGSPPHCDIKLVK